MPIQTACPNCGKDYNLADAMKGKNVKCKNCASIFLVEAVAAKTPVPTKTPKASGTMKAPAKPVLVKSSPKRPADEEIPEVLAAGDDDDPDVDDRPARKSSKKSAGQPQPRKKSSGMLWLLLGGGGALGFLLLIACAGGLWWMLGGGFGKTIDIATFKQLRQGMTEAEVFALLGKPTTTQDGATLGIGANVLGNTKTCIWRGGGNEVTVVFTDGKAWFASGVFKEANGGSTTLTGFFTSGPVAQNPPPPPAPNPPPQNPSPPGFPPDFKLPPGFPVPGTQPQKQPPPNNPPPPPPNNPPPPPTTKPPTTKPAMTGPAKVTQGVGFPIISGLNKDQVLLLTSGEQPTSKHVAEVKTPNGAKASETWIWKNGKGHLTVYFDKKGLVVDKEEKDLPKQ